MTEIIPIITKHVAPHLKHRVTADGILADLDLCPIARFFSIPCEIEEQHDVGQFDDAEIEGWLTVRDIEVMVEARTPKAIEAGTAKTGTTMSEEWRRVPVAPYRNYEVSSHGRIRRNGKVMSPVRDSDGYLTVKLYYAGIPKRFKINRLVCEAFHGPAQFPNADAAHDDGVRSNNAAGNLAWKTRKANLADKLRHGTHQAGDLGGTAKLTWEQVRTIRERAQHGEPRPALAREYGLALGHLRRIVIGEAWKNDPHESAVPQGGIRQETQGLIP